VSVAFIFNLFLLVFFFQVFLVAAGAQPRLFDIADAVDGTVAAPALVMARRAAQQTGLAVLLQAPSATGCLTYVTAADAIVAVILLAALAVEAVLPVHHVSAVGARGTVPIFEPHEGGAGVVRA
jgi:hypothetical protein